MVWLGMSVNAKRFRGRRGGESFRGVDPPLRDVVLPMALVFMVSRGVWRGNEAGEGGACLHGSDDSHGLVLEPPHDDIRDLFSESPRGLAIAVVSDPAHYPRPHVLVSITLITLDDHLCTGTHGDVLERFD